MGPVPPEGNAGNPAFLLDVLPDCFSGWLYLDCFANTPPWDGARNDKRQARRLIQPGGDLPHKQPNISLL